MTLLRNIDEEYNEYRNVGTDHGVLISVQEGGPAAQAGLVDYDIITAVDGTEILDVYHLQEEIFNHNVGDTVTLTILRSGESQEAVSYTHLVPSKRVPCPSSFCVKYSRSLV